MSARRIDELEARIALLERAVLALGASVITAPAAIPTDRDYEMRERIGPIVARLLMDGPATHAAIVRKVKNFATTADVENVMQWMSKGGDVKKRIVQAEGPGRPSIVYEMKLTPIADLPAAR